MKLNYYINVKKNIYIDKPELTNKLRLHHKHIIKII